MADNPDLEALNARADECWSQIQKFMTRRGAIQTRRDALDDRRTRLLELEERLHGGQLSGRRRRVVHGGQQHLGVQLPRHPGTGRWSPHAFGRAIDLNPLLNP
jgi:hypothetical protein